MDFDGVDDLLINAAVIGKVKIGQKLHVRLPDDLQTGGSLRCDRSFIHSTRAIAARISGDNKAPTFPRTYQAAMKAVNARKTKLRTFEIAECGYRNQTGNQTQNTTKYEKKMAINHRLGRDFIGILW